MDATEVTNEQFSKFIEATNYVTVAERTPRAEDFPGAPPENLVAGAVVFAPPSHPVPLNDHFQWWSYAKGANWRHPEGPASSIAHRDRYPVVQGLPEAPNPVVARLLDRHTSISRCPKVSATDALTNLCRLGCVDELQIVWEPVGA